MKKIAALVLCGALLCGLTGCAFGRKEETIDPKYSPRAYSEQALQNIQDYLKNGNAEALSAMFADYYVATTQEVQGLLNFIDGKIVSFDNNSLECGGKSVKYGEYSKYFYNGRFTVKTSNQVEYQVYFNGAAVHEKQPEKVGVEDITFINLANEKDRYGIGNYYNEKGQKLDFDGNVVEW